MEAFRAFVTTYGVTLQVPQGRTKLIVHQVVVPRIEAEEKVTKFICAFPLHVLDAADQRVADVPQVRARNWMQTVDNHLCIAMAYVVNQWNYWHDLQAHGVEPRP